MAAIDLSILALVALGVILLLQRRGERTGPPPADDDKRQMADEIRELRARVHVLERALTDNHAGADLSSEIERLRDR